jgi:hypothetical protein
VTRAAEQRRRVVAAGTGARLGEAFFLDQQVLDLQEQDVFGREPMCAGPPLVVDRLVTAAVAAVRGSGE